jgi:hypothetical protein
LKSHHRICLLSIFFKAAREAAFFVSAASLQKVGSRPCRPYRCCQQVKIQADAAQNIYLKNIPQHIEHAEKPNNQRETSQPLAFSAHEPA